MPPTAEMQRRVGIPLLFALLSLSAGCRRSEAPSAAATSPAKAPTPGLDVVLITVDTLRADAPGFAGNTRVKTPAMDTLAARGAVFSNAHAHNVVTLPSHANILTGKLPYEHGVRDNAGFRLPETVPTLATRLKALGYSTGAFVAAFPLDGRFGLARGFDVYDDRYGKGADTGSFRLAERPGTEVVTAAAAWFEAQPAGRRFLFVHLFEPHAPYEPPPPFQELYKNDPYLGEVAAADSALAPLLATLPERTLIILTGDHGESLGEHGEATHGLFAYEATLHVPLVVAGPGLTPGRDARPVGHIDILPTVLAAVGAPADAGLSGRSLLSPDDRGTTITYFEALSAQLNRGWAPLTGVLRGGTKFVDLPIKELYDLAADPKELTNLATKEDAKLRDLARARPEAALRPSSRTAPSSEETARLRSLGYVASQSAARATYTEDDDPKRLVAVDLEIHRIIDLYQRGQMRQAIQAAEALVSKRPTMEVGLEHLAFLYQQANRPADAARVLLPAVARGYASDTLRVRLGLALSEMGRAGEAVRVLAPLEASHDPEALNALGIALADSRELARARGVLEKALAADPENPTTSMNAGIVALREGQADQARSRFQRALELNPKLTGAWNGLGAAEASLGHVDAALGAWAKVIFLDPRDFDALYNLGTTAAKAGRPKEAGAALRRFVALAPPARYAREIAEAKRLLVGLPPA